MSCCVALLLDEGLLFASDTRTHAGVDQGSIFPKMHVFEERGDRVSVLLTAGNLGITQSAVNRLRDAEPLNNHHAEFNASILIGGQIKGEQRRLFNVYAAGNFIESRNDTPYFQIGETKYGKPIIDRVVKHDSDMLDVVKCVLISFDSAIRSSISLAAQS